MSVDLPDPERPTTATCSPAAIDTLTPRSASTAAWATLGVPPAVWIRFAAIPSGSSSSTFSTGNVFTALLIRVRS